MALSIHESPAELLGLETSTENTLKILLGLSLATQNLETFEASVSELGSGIAPFLPELGQASSLNYSVPTR